jgi:hypothetical protein
LGSTGLDVACLLPHNPHIGIGRLWLVYVVQWPLRTSILDTLVSEFGSEVTAKLQTGAGQEEAQLRDPFARLLRQAGAVLGVQVLTVDETPLDVLGVRPDFMVSVAGARVGYAELKAPGKKVPTTRPPMSRDRSLTGISGLVRALAGDAPHVVRDW